MSVLSTITLSSRSLKMEANYQRHRKKVKDEKCTMCRLSEITSESDDEAEQIISQHDYMYVTKNIFPYSVWDGSPVVDHIMVIPKRHIVSLSTLTNEEKREWASLVTLYEEQNYSIYARSSNNGAKSIVHQHTHLIKVGPRKKQPHFVASMTRILTGK